MGRTVSDGKVLVVDDDPLVRDSVSLVLRDEGYSVDHAANGADALAKVAVDPPDVILLDVMMPNMTGPQVLKALRDDQGRATIPVVVMTAISGMAHPIPDGVELVEKPFDVEDLLNKVALAMFRSDGRR